MPAIGASWVSGSWVSAGGWASGTWGAVVAPPAEAPAGGGGVTGGYKKPKGTRKPRPIISRDLAELQDLETMLYIIAILDDL